MSAEFSQALEDINDLQNELRRNIEEGDSMLEFCEKVRKLELLLKPKVKDWELQLETLNNFSRAYRDKVSGGADLFSSLLQSSSVTRDGSVDKNTADQMLDQSTFPPSVCSASGSSTEGEFQLKNHQQSNGTHAHTAEPTSTEISVSRGNVCEHSPKISKPDGLEALLPEMANLFKTPASSISHCSENMDNVKERSAMVKCIENDRMLRDQNVFLQIFPEEIWLHVLENINEPKTLESVSNSSPFLRSLLFPRRVEFLFPKVWNVLGKKYHEVATDFSNRDQCYIEPDIYENPLPWRRQRAEHQANEENDVAPTRWFTGIIKLRMVCKAWRDAVDNWFQAQQHVYQITNDDVEQLPADRVFSQINGFSETWCSNWVVDRMDLFHRKFMASHVVDGVAQRNPFFGRAVLLITGGERHAQQAREFWNRVKDIFLVYGTHIWYLTVSIDEVHHSRLDCYSILRALLQAAPNLRKLHLSYNATVASLDNVGKGFMQEDLIQLNDIIISDPLPRLDSLEFITTRRITVFEPLMPPPLFRELVRSNGHIERLEIGHRYYYFHETNLSLVTVPNLRVFFIAPLTHEECDTFFGSSVGWKLVKLNLDLRNSFIELNVALREVGLKWGESLTCLKLKLPILENVEDQERLLEQSGNFRLNLPRLTHLTLVMQNLCCLDFLLPMRESLESIELKVRDITEHTDTASYLKSIDNGKKIKLFSMTENPAKLNIWQIFRRLRNMHLDFDVGSRLDTRRRFSSCHTFVRRFAN